MRFLYVRHGESEANAAATIGIPSTKLTSKGIAQAQKTGVELQDQNVALIICSPFIRAQQTAEIIAGEVGVDLRHIVVIDELHERRMGVIEGAPKEQESEWFYGKTDVEGMESQEDLLARSARALKRIEELARDVDGSIVVVGHAVSGFYLLQVAKGNTSPGELEDFHQMPNADYIVVEA